MPEMFERQPPTLTEQIAELRRELGQRARVYPRFVADGKLRQDRADYQVTCLEAAVRSLQELQQLGQSRA